MEDSQKLFGKYGRNPGADATLKAVWTKEIAYPWPAVAATTRIRSTSASDTMDAQVFGLLDDFSPVMISVTLTGTTWITLPVDLYRCFRVRPRGATATAGKIEVDIGGVVVAEVLIGRGSTEMAVFTVPKGTGGLWHTETLANVDGNKGGYFEPWIRDPGHSFYNAGHLYVPAEAGSFQVKLDPPAFYAEGMDIEMRGSATQSGQVSVSFRGRFVERLIYETIIG